MVGISRVFAAKATMIIKEYRVTLPLTVDEYQIGQLYAVSELSKTQGLCDSMKILKNEPFENVSLMGGAYTQGQYTHKLYYVDQKVPAILRFMVRGSLDLHEECWNAYPYTKTTITNPPRKDAVHVCIESIHLPDRGTQENALGLPPEQLKLREVICIDIGNDPVEKPGVSKEPSKYISRKTGRGPFKGKWRESAKPVMTCYKLITVDIKIWAFKQKVENYLQNYQRRVMTYFHQDLICMMDDWIGMTMNDIREFEERTKEELERMYLEPQFGAKPPSKRRRKKWQDISKTTQ